MEIARRRDGVDAPTPPADGSVVRRHRNRAGEWDEPAAGSGRSAPRARQPECSADTRTTTVNAPSQRGYGPCGAHRLEQGHDGIAGQSAAGGIEHPGEHAEDTPPEVGDTSWLQSSEVEADESEMDVFGHGGALDQQDELGIGDAGRAGEAGTSHVRSAMQEAVGEAAGASEGHREHAQAEGTELHQPRLVRDSVVSARAGPGGPLAAAFTAAVLQPETGGAAAAVAAVGDRTATLQFVDYAPEAVAEGGEAVRGPPSGTPHRWKAWRGARRSDITGEYRTPHWARHRDSGWGRAQMG